MGWLDDIGAKIKSGIDSAGASLKASRDARAAEQQQSTQNFFKGATDWWNNVTGKTQKDAGTSAQAAGQGSMGQAAGTLGNISTQDPAKVAAAAQQAGASQGEQMGRTAAAGVGQAAAQSARTSGLNAGQAALLGGQQTSQAFNQGQQAGQQLGQQAYQNAAANQISAATGQAAAGAGQASAGATQTGQGQQQGKDFWGGVTGFATSLLGLPKLAEGGVATKPTKAVIGEKGPEAVIPLAKLPKVFEAMKKAGLVGGKVA